MRTNKLHFFLLLLMCFCLNFSVQAEASIHIIKGKVTCEGKGIQGIMVTDGRICVQTDASGKYNIPTLGDSRFVYICTPSGYRDYPSDCVNRKLRDFSRSFFIYILTL